MDRNIEPFPAMEPASCPNERGNQNTGKAETLSLARTPPTEQDHMIAKKNSFHPNSMRSTRNLIFTAWRFEIVSIFASFAVLAGVVAILAAHDGRPNPAWSGGITLNTVVSFGSMLFGISLMVPVASCISQMGWVWFAQARKPLHDVISFDQASRSLYGSLRLICTFHIRYVNCQSTQGGFH
jgi:hypothetical protein